MTRRNSRRNTRRNPYDRDKDLNAAEVVVFYILQSLDYDHPWAARPILIDAMNEIERDAEYKRAKIKPAYESAYRALNSALEILEERVREYGGQPGERAEDDDEYDEDDDDHHHGSEDAWAAMEREKERIRREIMEKAREVGRKASKEQREKTRDIAIKRAERKIESLQRELEKVLSQGRAGKRLIQQIEKAEKELEEMLYILG